MASDEGGPPDPAGLKTTIAGNPSQNLYWMAHEEFENISYLAIAMLSENGYMPELIEKAKRNDSFFLELANVVMQVEPQNLKLEFEREFGKAWPKRYKEIFQSGSGRAPLPPPSAVTALGLVP